MPTRSIPILPGYEVQSRIGRGAGAVISLAWDTAGARRVAIKHIVRRGPDDDRYIAQAENEYAVTRGVSHRYLRQCFDIVRVRKWLKTRELALVMEYVPGERLEDECPENLARIVEVFIKVAKGLGALHRHGFAHADIKPNNILLTDGGDVKIIDFGQSCPLGHTKERVQGTPDYMAPEQVLRHPIDQRTDVYNLGATMYWVVTGKWFKTMLTVTAPTATRIALESERGNAPPHELNPQVPLPLSNLIMACCAVSKDKRPRDMRDVLARLKVVRHLLTREREPEARQDGRVPEC